MLRFGVGARQAQLPYRLCVVLECVGTQDRIAETDLEIANVAEGQVAEIVCLHIVRGCHGKTVDVGVEGHACGRFFSTDP